jgi:hypothetical protein
MSNLREKQSSKVWRVVLSFIMFVTVVLLSLAVDGKTVFFNKSYIQKTFISYKYVNSLRDSVIDYTEDLYLQNGLDSSTLDDVFDYTLVRNAVKAYIADDIGYGSGYNENTYIEPIESLCGVLGSDITTQVKESDTMQYSEENVSRITESVKSYMKSEIDIGSSRDQTIVNIGSVASTVLLCVSLFFTVAAGLILFFTGKRRYRSIRGIGISFYTAGAFELIISLMACIIFKIKHIYIFPLYFRDVVMSYIHHCIGAVAITGGLLLVVGLIDSVIVWKVKRGE